MTYKYCSEKQPPPSHEPSGYDKTTWKWPGPARATLEPSPLRLDGLAQMELGTKKTIDKYTSSDVYVSWRFTFQWRLHFVTIHIGDATLSDATLKRQ